MSTNEYAGVVWLCFDCTHAHANGGSDLPAALSLLLDCEITSGILQEEHEDYCSDETWEECGCDFAEFSWSACEGCGSTLGGERTAHSLWVPAKMIDSPKQELLLLTGTLVTV